MGFWITLSQSWNINHWICFWIPLSQSWYIEHWSFTIMIHWTLSWFFVFLYHSHETLNTELDYGFLCHSHDTLNTESVFGFLCNSHDTLNTVLVFEFLLDRVRRATRTSNRCRSLRYSWASDSCSTPSSGVKRKQSKGDNQLLVHTHCTV